MLTRGCSGLLAVLLCSGVCLHCHAADGPQQRTETAWLYGNLNKYAYYYANLFVGSPVPQRTSVIVDTGSHLIGFACKGCLHCGRHIDPAFDLSRSQTARWLNCTSACSDCVDGYCEYEALYSEGSSVSGRWFQDLMQFEGPADQKHPAVRAWLGCHRSEQELFYSQRADGIMGLAPSSSSLNRLGRGHTILHDLFSGDDHVNASVFSLCLSTWGGRLTIGGYEPSYRGSSSGPADSVEGDASPSGTIQWVAMVPDQYYRVFPSGLMLGSMVVAAGVAAFGQTIVDSGTTFSSFPGPVFHNLVNDLNTYCSLQGCGAEKEASHTKGEEPHSDCWRLHRMLRGPKDFPMLRLHFVTAPGGGLLPGRDIETEWPPHAYLHQSANEPSVWCRSFMEADDVTTVLGISWMLHKDVIFDLEQKRLGIMHTTCPQHGRPADFLEEVAGLSAAPPRVRGRRRWGEARGRVPADGGAAPAMQDSGIGSGHGTPLLVALAGGLPLLAAVGVAVTRCHARLGRCNRRSAPWHRMLEQDSEDSDLG